MGALGPRFPQSQRPVPGDEGRLAASQELSLAAGVRFALHSVRETVLPACGVCPFTPTATGGRHCHCPVAMEMGTEEGFRTPPPVPVGLCCRAERGRPCRGQGNSERFRSETGSSHERGG